MPPLLHNEVYFHDNKEKTETFVKVIFRDNDDSRSKVVPDYPRPRPNDGRPKLAISQELYDAELCQNIKDLPRRKASGPDDIPNEAIQLGGDPLRYHLLRCFQVCLKLGYHPAIFKDSILIMSRKSGREPHLPKSWRPIVLLSCIGKLLEKIVALRMVAALKDRLVSTQFGGRSTTEALQFMLAIVYGAWSKSPPKVVTLLALDISGAYDNMDRAKLLERLVDESMPDWIIGFNRSFLSNRRARFHMPGYKSDSIGLQTGIPQGSPLSPILFLIYASPLMHVSLSDMKDSKGGFCDVKVYTFSFVDDTYLIAVSKSYERNCRALAAIHNRLLEIARPLSITFGPEKYDLMHFR